MTATMRRLYCGPATVEVHARGENLAVWLSDVGPRGGWCEWVGAGPVALSVCNGVFPLSFFADWIQDFAGAVTSPDNAERVAEIMRDAGVRDCPLPF